MKILLTVDTEMWPHATGWPAQALPPDKKDFSDEFAMYIDGTTPSGSYGLGYQLALLEKYQLRSTWFIEPLFSARAGMDHLRRVVTEVRNKGQEIGLHLHTEWLRDARVPGLPQTYRQFICQFSLEEQKALIGWGRDRLLECGAEHVRVFRAGSFGADRRTAQALEEIGITQDSSLNPSLEWSFPDLPLPRATATQPFRMGAVQEFPVANFGTAHETSRHVQICACSSAELEGALLAAHDSNWEVFVIFWHTGEFVRRRRPNRHYGFHVRRFEALCQFLDRHRDILETVHFCELAQLPMTATQPPPIRVSYGATARRIAEQIASRVL